MGKKTLEINPRHPLIKELLRRVEDNPADKTASDMAVMMYNTATLRSGYSLKDTVNFAQQIEAMMRQTLGVDADEQVEEEEELQMRNLQRKTRMMKRKRKTRRRRKRR